MSQVNKQIMYHISKCGSWHVGDIIQAGEAINPFWETCMKFPIEVTINNQKMPLLQALNIISDLQVSKDNIIFLCNTLKNLSTETIFYIREQTFENVRKEYFPDRPSRHTCLWVSDAKALEYWETMSPNTERCLLTLELTGELFCAYENWLKADTFSSVEYQERARHYWSGEQRSSNTTEYLFCGQAIVKEVKPFKKYEDIVQFLKLPN